MARGRRDPVALLGRLALAVALALAGASAAPRQHAAAARPRLVLFISVDQMRPDYLERFGSLFAGGFKTLSERGAIFTNARYRHANNETGPGHAVLLTGRLPRSSGIVMNEWWDRALRRVVNVVEDPVHVAVGGEGRGASPANMIGFTLGDALKHDSPGSRVVGVALKDRAAILLAGRRADAAYWYEAANGRFVTSTYYMRQAPAWLDALNARRIPDSWAGRLWERLLPDEGVYLRFAGPDAVEGEFDRTDTVFPHAVRGRPPDPLFYEDFRRTPMADELTLEVALAALDAHEASTRGVTDLLAVGFSATDVIGHAYGPDSQELMDQMLRLDRTLGRLFDAVGQRVGLEHTIVVLSSDHGVMPLVEVARRRSHRARRVRPEELRAPVLRALAQRFGPGAEAIVAHLDPPNAWLDERALGARGLRRADVEATVRRALLGTGVVEAVYTARELLGDPPRDDPFFLLHRNALYPPRSPDLIGRFKEYVYVNDRPGGTGHGSAYDYDRHVPIVFMGPGIRPGRYDQSCGPEDIAFTLARLIGVQFPQQDAERTLSEMLR